MILLIDNWRSLSTPDADHSCAANWIVLESFIIVEGWLKTFFEISKQFFIQVTSKASELYLVDGLQSKTLS